MSEQEERARGVLATASRYAETAFSVIASGPSAYAKADWGPRYSSPAEFLVITLVINGLASLGLHTAVASAVDESKTAEHVSSLSLAALASIGVILISAFAAAWAARLSGRKIPRDILWRVSCYTTAFTLLVIPLTGIWLTSLDWFLPDEDISDEIRYLLPALPIGIVSLVAFIRGVVKGFQGRRIRFVLLFLLLDSVIPAFVRALPAVPVVGAFIREHSQPSLNAAGGQAIESLSIRRAGSESFGPLNHVEEHDRVQLLIEIRNLSSVTAHNVKVRVEGPFLRGPQKYVFYSIASCDGCGRDDVGHAQFFWHSNQTARVRRLSATMYRNYDYKKSVPLPYGQTVDALFSDTSLLLGDVRSEPDARLQIVIDLEADPELPADIHDYPAPLIDYPDGAPVIPKATVEHSPQGAQIPPPASTKK